MLLTMLMNDCACVVQFRILAWFEEINGGPITSISFDRNEEFIASVQQKSDDDVFSAPNFIAGTSSALIVAVDSSTFEDAASENRKGVMLTQGQEAPVQALAAHPFAPKLAVAGYSGHLHLWDYVEKRLLLVTVFNNLMAHCMCFDPTGSYLGENTVLHSCFVMSHTGC